MTDAAATAANSQASIAVVIPCYKVREQILNIMGDIGPECSRIYVVDDACPDSSGEWVREHCDDPRVEVLFNDANLGVGGATMAGYRKAGADGATVIVKLDGDGQMDPADIPRLVAPLFKGEADYCKGNRFYNIEDTVAMPRVRLAGNMMLSFMSKFSTGYWNIFDPTNGFTAIRGELIDYLPLEKISDRYFFESDMLFRLNLLGCVVRDVPQKARYGSEVSNLKVHRELFRFAASHIRNTAKRLTYTYFIRDFSLASIELLLGPLAVLFGVSYGLWKWISLSSLGIHASSGEVMIAALPIIIGTQLLLSALNYDVQNVPRHSFADSHPSIVNAPDQPGPPGKSEGQPPGKSVLNSEP